MSENLAAPAPATAESVPSVIKSVIVPVPVAQAWEIFTEHPEMWWPSDHKVVPGQRESIEFEPYVGGSYLERNSEGEIRVWGKILIWEPPRRLRMTWRIDGRWQSITDDSKASEIDVTFTSRGVERTEVTLGHVCLHKHGADAAAIRAALDGPSPGQTLGNYAQAVDTFLAPVGWRS